MADFKLSYFAFPGGRGEDCRLALHIAGVAFDDDRIEPPRWPALKGDTPMGALPVLEVAGSGRLAQSNAILSYLGRRFELHPSDPWRAAQHEALMASVEDARAKVSDTLRVTDPDAKKQQREELAAGYLQDWAKRTEPLLGNGPFIEGERLNVADLKLFVFVKWFAGGTLDHIPANVFEKHARLTRVYEAVRAHPAVVAWYARA